MPPSLTRRAFIAASVVALAGCNDGGQQADVRSPSTSAEGTLVVTESSPTAVTSAPSGSTEQTPSSTTPSTQPVLEVGRDETQTASDAAWYDGIEWHDGGQLIIESGAGLGLTEI
ncbi:haloacid dehalogenase superfamily enzyme, subfamily IA [Halogeometricum borinquense DSM 11551]|uniref:Haloacid dehalogenase superfamily enzyme, subfamily IA n=2 Tax=Halogeometricum borinquense TaxID=60847 RepID=E4NVR4_HALBP|nr:hypothetical protein [Halogeometricum borinquense]ADQ69134.1 haloacid dehalogenase superfamily enzyme, subfamily IA [Halogeometricum borinquense DSM 11551]ELY31806.1 haloacid dehalogenase superfamily enzyme, subfamily IA [Halogeometricum borinquense DSM 11551]RYJ08411.1 haloacid dehalogenase [Halogeometricum borinquense]